MVTSPKVPVGLGTYVGYGLAALSTVGALDSVIVQNFPSTGKWCVVAGAIIASFTTLGRMIQAAAVNGAPAAQAIDAGATQFLELYQQAGKTAASLPADGVDSPAVPFSGAQPPPAP